MKTILVILVLFLTGCTVHVCGNSEVAHAVGQSSVGEQQQNEDSAEAKADVKVPEGL